MKENRKRKIARVIKPHAISLMNMYFNNEHSLATLGVSAISDKRSWEICDILSQYAQILYRSYDERSDIYNNEWAMSLHDFY